MSSKEPSGYLLRRPLWVMSALVFAILAITRDGIMSLYQVEGVLRNPNPRGAAPRTPPGRRGAGAPRAGRCRARRSWRAPRLSRSAAALRAPAPLLSRRPARAVRRCATRRPSVLRTPRAWPAPRPAAFRRRALPAAAAADRCARPKGGNSRLDNTALRAYNRHCQGMRKHPSLPAVLTSAAGRLFLFRTAFAPTPSRPPSPRGRGSARGCGRCGDLSRCGEDEGRPRRRDAFYRLESASPLQKREFCRIRIRKA